MTDQFTVWRDDLTIFAGSGTVFGNDTDPERASFGRCVADTASHWGTSVWVMSVAMTVLGLVEASPRHGYEVRKVYDAHFGGQRPLKVGQLYATLGRLERDALIAPAGVDQLGGPERTVFAATPAGRDRVASWLGQAEPDAPYLQSVVFAKVLLALMAGRPAAGVLEVQRAAHLLLMRQWTALRREEGTAGAAIAADFVLFHLDADLRWLDATAARLDRLAAEVAP